MQQRILLINSSGRQQDSVTRHASDLVVQQLQQMSPAAVMQRDLAAGLPFVNEAWIGANFTAAEQRNAAQLEQLGISDALVNEIQQAEVLVIASPIYNFGIPATLKAWVDQIARAGVTFRYTEAGPVGLMRGKRAILVMASGGVPIGSELDFATPYLQQVMRFIGITDITVVDANSSDEQAIKLQLLTWRQATTAEV
ncbi:FMN-dependent NADH-azoreductase [Marinicella meishanensis]|uniref:FMN-dependent NADH-azoreductase n=1 Tax=Marinicella meishanensis TaxID=2873263 RepID=UPI001CBC2217|nr:NAD(P)H-dependent oxidoreductase [Marinicella sp. NBU2979]